MNGRPCVEVVGNTVADILVETPRFAPGTDEEFSRDSLVVLEGPARLSVGGNAGRLALVLGRLGLEVRLYTSIGQDAWGAWLRSELVGAGVELKGETTARSATNVVATDGDGKRMSLFFPGGAAPGPAGGDGQCALAVFATCPLPGPASLATWAAGRRRDGVPALVDIGPPVDGGRTLNELGQLGEAGVCLTMNEAELAQLTGAGSLRQGLAELQRAGFQQVVVKLGRRGAAVLQGPSGTGLLVGTAALPMVGRSTVGAGDIFNAGLAYGLVSGLSLAEAAAVGNRMAHKTLSGEDVRRGDGPELLSHVDRETQHLQEV
jgi:ribokinase